MTDPVQDAVAALGQVEASETANRRPEQRDPGTWGEQRDVRPAGEYKIPAHFSDAVNTDKAKRPDLGQG